MRPLLKSLCAVWVGASALNAVAGTQALESAVLRLEMDTAPFSFWAIEKSTGTILLSQSTNFFAFGTKSNAVSSASNIVVTATTLDADLVLAGTSAVAHVTFNFTQPEIIQTTFTGPTNATQIYQQFTDQGENLYGVWEYPFGGTLNIRGTDQPLLGTQVNANINYSSARAPFYLTSRHYGVYAQTDAQGRFTMAVSGKTSFWFTNISQLTFHIIYGTNYADILAQYNGIAGGAFMPPTWAFSTIWWKDDDHADFHTNALDTVTNAQGNVLDTANQLRFYHIPASAMWIDRPYGTPTAAQGGKGWGNFDFDSSFPNPSQMVSDLNARGMNLMLWIANLCLTNTYLYTNGQPAGYLFPGISLSSTLGPAADFRITNAYIWFRSNLNAFVNLGIKGYKIDRGEQGEQPDYVQNKNVTLFHKLAAEGQAAVHPNDNFVFTRNACDNSRKYAAIWNGDSSATFAGLQYSVISGLRSGLINFPMWSADTGGYVGAPTEELFARWFEFSTYVPMMETVVGNSRTPWYNYSTNLIAIARTQAAAHHDLIPYSRSCLYKATQTGMPVMRALFLNYPNDNNVTNTGDEYLYGNSLLVAPVLTAGATNRNVYLPAGNWLDYNTRSATYAGPANLTAAAPLATIPLFVNEGAVIPRGDILQANNNWTTNWSPQLRIEIFPSDNFNSSFDYYTGSAVQTITCSNQNHTLTIQFGDLGLGGNLEIYTGNADSVVRNGTNLVAGTDYTYNATQRLLSVPFNGATTLVVAGERSLFAPIEVWRTATFGTNAANTAIAGNNADPDHDGVLNFLEYAFGLNPLAASSSGLPTGTVQNNVGTNYLALKFQRATNATDCTFTVLVSGDLIQWLTGSSYSGPNIIFVTTNTTEVSRSTTNGIETIIVRDNVPMNAAPQRFMTVHVTDP